MKIRMDKAGRVVLPKPVRDRHGLRAGAELEVTESSEGLWLKTRAEKPAMIRVNGLWVHQGSPPKGFDWGRFEEEEREARHRRNLGL